MTSFSRDDLHRLAAVESTACITIYMPARRIGSALRIDTTRLKNLARSARAALMQRLGDEQSVDELIRPIEILADLRSMWKDSEHGVVIFRSPELIDTYRVNGDISESVHVDTCFDLLPLVQHVADEATFFILSLDRRNIKLYRASRLDMTEVSLGSVPSSLAEFNRTDEYSREPQMHSASFMSVQGRSKRGTIFHEGETRRAREKADFLDFLSAIEPRVMGVVEPTRAPLVLAGLQSARALYRSVTSYPWIAPGGIRTGLPASEMLEAARSLASPLLERRELEVVERFGRLAGTGRASSDPDEILRRARYGDVATLLVAGDGIDDSSLGAAVGPRSRAVAQVLRSDGDVLRVTSGALHNGMAAVFRY